MTQSGNFWIYPRMLPAKYEVRHSCSTWPFYRTVYSVS